MRIDVTQEHIAQGLEDSCFSCPVARALVDAIVPLKAFKYWTVEAAVDPNTIRIKDIGFGGGFTVDTPPKVRAFVESFDANGPNGLSPFSFEIDLPAAPTEVEA